MDLAVSAWALDRRAYDRVAPALHARAPEVAEMVQRRLHGALDTAWRGGWSPAEVAHATARRLEPRHVDLLAGLVVADGRRRAARGERLHHRWAEELAVLADRRGPERVGGDPGGLATATALLSLLLRLGTVPPTVPRPGAPAGAPTGRGLDPRLLARIRALLAKAESTEFEQEAEALTAKAQELIARHAIDDALLHTGEEVGAPAVRRILLDDPYAEAKAHLVAAVAAANGCRTVYSPDAGSVTAFGYEGALDAVELLAASLLAQATAAMTRHGSQRDATGRSRTRSFRRSFLYGFGTRIGQRLRAAADDQVAAAGATDALLPVLAAREERIEEAVAAAFPALARRRVELNHAGGWEAGRVAADLAELQVGSARLGQRAGREDVPGGG